MKDAAAGEVLLRAVDLRKTYGEGEAAVRALRGIDLEVRRGDSIAVMGPSGSGKSTLLHIMGMLHRPSSGEFKIFGHDYGDLDRRQTARLRNRSIGFVFQDCLLIPTLTVLENAALPLVYAEVVKPERHRRARALLHDLGLGHRIDHRAGSLSGGESQRTAIARALINDPDIILADEPTGSLDQENGRHILEILDDLNRRGKTVIVVTHDPQVARHSQRTLTLVDGRIVGDSLPGPASAEAE